MKYPMSCETCASTFRAPRHNPKDCQMYKNWWINREAFNWRILEVHPTWFLVDNPEDG